MALMALLGDSADHAVLVPTFVLFGIRTGLGSTPPTEAILESLPAAQPPAATARQSR